MPQIWMWICRIMMIYNNKISKSLKDTIRPLVLRHIPPLGRIAIQLPFQKRASSSELRKGREQQWIKNPIFGRNWPRHDLSHWAFWHPSKANPGTVSNFILPHTAPPSLLSPGFLGAKFFWGAPWSVCVCWVTEMGKGLGLGEGNFSVSLALVHWICHFNHLHSNCTS